MLAGRRAHVRVARPLEHVAGRVNSFVDVQVAVRDQEVGSAAVGRDI